MASTLKLARLRQPEYTGNNRCVPCTTVNLIIAAFIAIGFAIVAAIPLGSSTAIAFGVALFVLFAAIIYLRGYLVPGTPHLTKTYLPDWILRWFDHHPASRTAWNNEGIDVETTLKRADVVQECDDAADLCLTDAFREAWTDRIELLRKESATRDDLAAFFDVDPDELTFEDHSNALVAYRDGTHLAQWESHAAFLADMASVPELRTRLDDWDEIGDVNQSKVIGGLRVFLEQCPACDGGVAGGQRRVESCCRSFDVIAMACQDCGAGLFEIEAVDNDISPR